MTGMEMIGVEVVKALLLAVLIEAQKRGLTQTQLDALYQSEKIKFQANKPENIPDMEG